MKCSQCKRKYPSHLLSPLFINGGYVKDVCPICALRMTNEAHGINRTEFTGTTAQEMLEEAQRLYP